MRKKGVRNVRHYLDDYVTFSPPASPECAQALKLIQQTCSELGVPLATEKLEGPPTCLTFLGIEIDSAAGVMGLPQDKLERVQHTLASWTHWKSSTRRDLESLVGTLLHACRVVRPGRSFLRRMIDLLRVPRRPPLSSRAPEQGRPVVVHIHISVERGFLLSAATPTSSDNNIGRIRWMGLWCMEPGELVPVPMAGHRKAPPYCIQRTNYRVASMCHSL